jgi:small subunit ribosomal protein S2
MELGTEGLTKKERLGMERDQSKLQASLGGIREMGKVPDILFVIDVNKEDLAVAEANKLGIPVVAGVDSNSSPDGIDYPIPGNDDASRAIAFYCDLIARAALDGMTAQMGAAGIDIGEAVEAPIEEALVEEKDNKNTSAKKIETVSDAALFVEEPVDDSDMLLNTPQEVVTDTVEIDPESKEAVKSEEPSVSEVESKSS